MYHLIMAVSTIRNDPYYFVGQIDDRGRVWQIDPIDRDNPIGPFVNDANWQYTTLRTYDFYWDAAHAKVLLLMAVAAKGELLSRFS